MRHGIAEELELALDLARHHFTDAVGFDWRPQFDVASGEEWLTIRVLYAGDAGAYLERYMAYADELVRRVPEPAAAMIRVTPDFVRL